MRNKSNKGFTLVELLVVLVVIGVLLGLILPNTLKAIKQANNRECASNVRSIETALQLCYSEKRKWSDCDSPEDLTGGNYLDVFPVCPFGVGYTIGDVDTGKGLTLETKKTHFDPWPPHGNDHK